MSSDPPPPYPGGPSAPIMEKNGQPGNNDTTLSALEFIFYLILCKLEPGQLNSGCEDGGGGIPRGNRG